MGYGFWSSKVSTHCILENISIVQVVSFAILFDTIPKTIVALQFKQNISIFKNSIHIKCEFYLQRSEK